MVRKNYVVPSVEIHDAAVSEPIIWYIILTLGAISIVGAYAALCTVVGGHFSWGVNYFWFVPYNIWVQCA